MEGDFDKKNRSGLIMPKKYNMALLSDKFSAERGVQYSK